MVDRRCGPENEMFTVHYTFENSLQVFQVVSAVVCSRNLCPKQIQDKLSGYTPQMVRTATPLR